MRMGMKKTGERFDQSNEGEEEEGEERGGEIKNGAICAD